MKDIVNSIVTDPRAFVGNDELDKIARELMKRLDMTRAFDCDYDICRETLRAVYDLGRCRGAWTSE